MAKFGVFCNGLSTIPMKIPIRGNPVFSIGLNKSLLKNSPYCPILCNWVFDNFILVDEPFAKALPNFATCVLVNNNLGRKESPTLIEEIYFSTIFYPWF